MTDTVWNFMYPILCRKYEITGFTFDRMLYISLNEAQYCMSISGTACDKNFQTTTVKISMNHAVYGGYMIYHGKCCVMIFYRSLLMDTEYFFRSFLYCIFRSHFFIVTSEIIDHMIYCRKIG